MLPLSAKTIAKNNIYVLFCIKILLFYVLFCVKKTHFYVLFYEKTHYLCGNREDRLHLGIKKSKLFYSPLGLHYLCSKKEAIMFERNTLTALKRWSERSDRKPLVLRGARQVGKTTLVEEFAKSYGTFLKLNLDKQEDAELFEKGMNTDSLITAIYMLNNKPRKNDSALLFIDEVQNSSKAVAQLRYFYEEAPNLHVIAAGSLLESLVGSNQISFPVGRVEYMAIRQIGRAHV